MTLLVIAATIATLLAVACGGEGNDTDGGGHEDHSMSAESSGAEGKVPGEPADPSETDRTIEITASDEMAFEPKQLEVAAGDVVTFAVTNTGILEHEFVLGDEAYQRVHGQEMSEGHGEMEDGQNAISLGPGETKELTWRFTSPTEVLYGCHEPGHYDGGMVGTITVG